LYTVEPVQFTDTSAIPSEFKTLMIIAPTDTIPEKHFKFLDDFLSRGGRILAAINTVKGDLSTGSGEKIHTGLEYWLKNKGIEVEENFVVDANCGNVMVRQQQGMFVMNTPVKFPYLPIITNFIEHPITEGLESVMFPFVSPIKLNPKDTSVVMYPLATTSENTGIQSPPIYFDVMKQWGATDFTVSEVPVAVVAEGKFINNTDSKIIVFGDGDFAVNGEGQEAQQLQPDNVNLFSNAVDWLSDDTGLIELRTKSVTARPLDSTLEDGTKTLIKYLNFLLPVILVILYGVFRFQVRRKIKNQLMATDYVPESK
ncbi:MAG: Gldg family protein, partial [Ignavibacteria bacterium]|nr:Gldg family protein [Ignavibacteria bacterium]